ncbi:hypothetical protein [Staphylococcus sp. LKG3-3]|uniref:hypothetical protein n=1 Tax=Staphylococcus sp. LKG3-3 TaxID=3399685 RepID=UPI003D4B052E
MKDKLLNINSIEVELLLLNVLTSGMGVIRAYAWIATEKNSLENTSPIYVKMNEYMDIQAMGWLLMIASIVLFLSEFMKETAQKYMYIISTFIGSIVNVLFGMIGVDNANIFTTYYTSMLVGIVMFIMFMLGVLDLWKTKRSQITD